MKQITAFLSAAKQLGASAVTCIFKGVATGIVLSLILTLVIFWWGGSAYGLKYVVGIIFFLLAGVALSLYRILQGELKLMDKTVESIANTAIDSASNGLTAVSKAMNAQAQFENVKSYIEGKCPAIKPLLSSLSFEQVCALAQKSSKLTGASKIANTLSQANDAPSLIKSFIPTIQLVWHAPVEIFMRKLIVGVVLVSAIIVGLRLIF